VFTHVMVGANDLEASKRFYDAALGALGIGEGEANGNRYFYRNENGTFAITIPIDGKPATFANGGTISFAAKSPEAVDAFHAAGLAAGGTECGDPPGLRDRGHVSFYIGYLRDPTGNKICALHIVR
jgi:catechol 2,3-dioxygenase-like lactoylglutathione lyase family enzyme